MTHPESGTTSYTYNTDGTVQQKVNADGTYLAFTYDGMGRVSTKTDSVTGCATSYRYDIPDPNDPSTPAGVQNTVGRLARVSWDKNSGCSMVNQNGKSYSFAEYYTYTAGGLKTVKRLTVTNGTGALGTDPRGNLDVTYGYNNEGTVTSTGYGAISNTYGLDGMGRPQSMTGSSSVSNASYGPSGEMLQVTYPFGTETRQYNARVQLTRISVAGQMDLEYRYSATQNNGQITQMKNWVSGEEVNYTYDTLSRLSTAVTTGPEWGLSFSYDGFGNRLSQTPTKGTAPSNTVAVDGATSRLIGHTYDARGNTLSMPGTSGLSYDSGNRLTGVTGAGDQYGYDSNNRRVYKNGQIFFYGVDGKVLGVYTMQVTTSISFTAIQTFQHFAGREISRKEDKLGSVQTGSRYYPYGEESPATVNDRQKFATYWRDANTTLDYAYHRYYQSALGRFVTPDPLDGSGKPDKPRSWNRYSYAYGDPSNITDPSGLLPPICEGQEEDCEISDQNPPDHQDDDPGPGAGAACGGSYVLQLWREMRVAAQRLRYFARETNKLLRANKDCASLYGTDETRANGFSPTAVVSGIFLGTTIQYGSSAIVPDLGAPLGLPLPFEAVTVGYTAPLTMTPNGLIGGTVALVSFNHNFLLEADTAAAELTILHELGHVYNILPGSGGSPILNDNPLLLQGGNQGPNDKLVINKCLQ